MRCTRIYKNPSSLAILVLVLLRSQSVYSTEEDNYPEPPANCEGDIWPKVTTQLGEPFPKEELAAGRKAAMDGINRWRRIHGVPALQMSDELNAKAQHNADCSIKWASWASKGVPFNPLSNELKEELSLTYYGDHAADHWYSDYCQNPSRDPKDIPQLTGAYFKKILWKSTTHFGIGFSRSTVGADGKHRTVVLSVFNPTPPRSSYAGDHPDVSGITILPAYLDNVVCCRNKDPAKGHLFRTGVDRGREVCLKSIPSPGEDDEHNGGGGGDSDGNGWNWWPGFLNFRFPWNSNGAGWWGYSGFHASDSLGRN